MTSAITLACIIILPIAIIMALRVNATFVFLSLCLGNVLAQFVATNTNSLTNLLSSSHISASLYPPDNNWKLTLLLLPVVITTLLMLRTVKGNSRKMLNLLPAIGVGLVGALLVVPVLPSAVAQNVVNNSLWSQLTHYQGIIVTLSTLACLSMLWLQRPKTGGGKHSKHSS
jgi:hypothetical protein